MPWGLYPSRVSLPNRTLWGRLGWASNTFEAWNPFHVLLGCNEQGRYSRFYSVRIKIPFPTFLIIYSHILSLIVRLKRFVFFFFTFVLAKDKTEKKLQIIKSQIYLFFFLPLLFLFSLLTTGKSDFNFRLRSKCSINPGFLKALLCIPVMEVSIHCILVSEFIEK